VKVKVTAVNYKRICEAVYLSTASRKSCTQRRCVRV